MDDRTGKIYDSETVKETMKDMTVEQKAELLEHLIPITEQVAEELKTKDLKERLGWLAEFRRKNQEAKDDK